MLGRVSGCCYWCWLEIEGEVLRGLSTPLSACLVVRGERRAGCAKPWLPPSGYGADAPLVSGREARFKGGELLNAPRLGYNFRPALIYFDTHIHRHTYTQTHTQTQKKCSVQYFWQFFLAPNP